MLRPENAYKNALYVGYSTPNAKALQERNPRGQSLQMGNSEALREFINSSAQNG